jgi:hypothetical protein
VVLTIYLCEIFRTIEGEEIKGYKNKNPSEKIQREY